MIDLPAPSDADVAELARRVCRNMTAAPTVCVRGLECLFLTAGTHHYHQDHKALWRTIDGDRRNAEVIEWARDIARVSRDDRSL